mmetsp:Transcript_17095/g.35587  ORF Transcript_17095/g.35587 Transcript_17095/m.35587 type:complete len:723 (-) Transcript_17095:1372-3540(-)
MLLTETKGGLESGRMERVREVAKLAQECFERGDYVGCLSRLDETQEEAEAAARVGRLVMSDETTMGDADDVGEESSAIINNDTMLDLLSEASDASRTRMMERSAIQLVEIGKIIRYNRGVVEFLRDGGRNPQPILEAMDGLVSDEPKAVDLFDEGFDEECWSMEEKMSFMLASSGATPLYNVAVLTFLLQKLRLAFRICDFLILRAGSLDTILGLRTCLLAIDISLRLDDFGDHAALNLAKSALVFLEKYSPGGSEKLHLSPPGDDSLNIVPAELPFQLMDLRRDVRFVLLSLRARVLSREGSLKAFKKEVKSAVVAAEDASDRPVSSALLIKARLERSGRKVLKVLSGVSTSSTSSEAQRPTVLNNAGVVHSRMQKFGLAAQYFLLAGKAFDDVLQRHPSLDSLGFCRRSEVAYNLGLQLYKLKKYRSALEAFGAALDQLAAYSPALWIRMAECVLLEDEAKEKEGAVESVSSLSRKSFVLRGRGSSLSKEALEFARTCGRCALALTLRHRSKASRYQGAHPHGPDTAGVAGGSDAISGDNGDRNRANERREFNPVSSSASSGLGRTEFEGDILEASLSIISYTSLGLNEPNEALTAARELLGIPGVSPERLFCAKMYLTEALCILRRPSEAFKHLSPDTLDTARLTEEQAVGYFTNLAIANSLRGDSNSAEAAFVSAFRSRRRGPPVKEVVALGAYLHLKDGNIHDAIKMMKSPVSETYQ